MENPISRTASWIERVIADSRIEAKNSPSVHQWGHAGVSAMRQVAECAVAGDPLFHQSRRAVLKPLTTTWVACYAGFRWRRRS